MIPSVTLLFTGLHGLILLGLVMPIVRLRRGRRVGLGDGGDRELLRRIRAHANFIEYVPILLVLLTLLEIGGLDRRVVATLGTMLIVGRLLHARGLSRSEGKSFGRMWGTLLTWSVLVIGSSLAIWLAVHQLMR